MPGDDENINRKSGLAYGAGLALFTSVVVFLIIGWLLDRWLSTGPWFLVAGITLGSVVGLIEFVKIASKLN